MQSYPFVNDLDMNQNNRRGSVSRVAPVIALEIKVLKLCKSYKHHSALHLWSCWSTVDHLQFTAGTDLPSPPPSATGEVMSHGPPQSVLSVTRPQKHLQISEGCIKSSKRNMQIKLISSETPGELRRSLSVERRLLIGRTRRRRGHLPSA